MFELMLVTCIGIRLCEYQLKIPQVYASQERCARQAAIIAGMFRGRHESRTPLRYSYACTKVGGDVARWIDGGHPPTREAELDRHAPHARPDTGD